MEGVKFWNRRGFRQYFVFPASLGMVTAMGPPDLESTQKGAPGDTRSTILGKIPYAPKITPLHLSTLYGNPCLVATSHSYVWPPTWQLPVYNYLQ